MADKCAGCGRELPEYNDQIVNYMLNHVIAGATHCHLCWIAIYLDKNQERICAHQKAAKIAQRPITVDPAAIQMSMFSDLAQ